MGDSFLITCPCCRTELVVDRESDSVIGQRSPKAPARSFEEAMSAEKHRAGQIDSVFKKAFTTVENEKDLLEKKLREALKKAKEDKDAPPPLRPIDLD